MQNKKLKKHCHGNFCDKFVRITNEYHQRKQNNKKIVQNVLTNSKKISLSLSNSNPVRSFKAKDRDHKQLNCT